MTEEVKAKLDVFEEKLKRVNDLSTELKRAVSLPDDTGFQIPSGLLQDFMSTVAWANNYLTVAAIELITEFNKPK